MSFGSQLQGEWVGKVLRAVDATGEVRESGKLFRADIADSLQPMPDPGYWCGSKRSL